MSRYYIRTSLYTCANPDIELKEAHKEIALFYDGDLKHSTRYKDCIDNLWKKKRIRVENGKLRFIDAQKLIKKLPKSLIGDSIERSISPNTNKNYVAEAMEDKKVIEHFRKNLKLFTTIMEICSKNPDLAIPMSAAFGKPDEELNKHILDDLEIGKQAREEINKEEFNKILIKQQKRVIREK